jgi:hypothetical protein
MMKRAFDVVVAAAALIAFAPPVLAMRLVLGKRVLFVPEHPGLHGVPFKLIKFRTMLEAYGPDGQPLPEEQRMTGLGGYLRSVSLDQLPNLWMVLKGVTSLVRPRPGYAGAMASPLAMRDLASSWPCRQRKGDESGAAKATMWEGSGDDTAARGVAHSIHLPGNGTAEFSLGR